MKKTIDFIDKGNFKFDNLPDRPEKPTSQEIADIIYPKPQGIVADTAYEIYSPNERVCGEWQQMVDGVLKKKPLYQKTISNSYGTISSSITSLDVGQITSDNSIDAVIDMNVTATYGGSTVTLQYFDAGSPLSTFTNYYYYNNHIGSRSNNTGASNALIRATVQYTKTTDEWQTVE